MDSEILFARLGKLQLILEQQSSQLQQAIRLIQGFIMGTENVEDYEIVEGGVKKKEPAPVEGASE